MTSKVLIVEDDPEIASVVSMNINDMGLKTDHASDGITGLEYASKYQYDLVILDIMLPGMDGIAVCRNIREKNPALPIMMLTAKAEEIDKVLALELGADDYMTKPFSVRELVARINALLRRARVSTNTEDTDISDEIIKIGDLVLDLKKHHVSLKNGNLDLTVKEYELLSLFMRNPGRAYSRNDLLNLIWGYQFEGYEHTVNTHINRLRNKIEEDLSNPVYLQTVWGVGYRFAEPGKN